MIKKYTILEFQEDANLLSKTYFTWFCPGILSYTKHDSYSWEANVSAEKYAPHKKQIIGDNHNYLVSSSGQTFSNKD